MPLVARTRTRGRARARVHARTRATNGKPAIPAILRYGKHNPSCNTSENPSPQATENID